MDGTDRSVVSAPSMAAVVRGGHARQGRRGRGGRVGRGAADAAEPAQGRVNLPGFQWLLWRDGNSNKLSTRKARKDEDESTRIFRELEDSSRVLREELNSYGIPDPLLTQRQEVVRVIREIVGKYNTMGSMRRRYLSRSLHGYQGKEMSSLLKKLQIHQEEVVGLHDEDVKKLHGYCPPTPPILMTTPKLQ